MNIYCVTYENDDDKHIQLITTSYDDAMIQLMVVPSEYDYSCLTTWVDGVNVKCVEFERE